VVVVVEDLLSRQSIKAGGGEGEGAGLPGLTKQKASERRKAESFGLRRESKASSAPVGAR
jgi:hypothetical protein